MNHTSDLIEEILNSTPQETRRAVELRMVISAFLIQHIKDVATGAKLLNITPRKLRKWQSGTHDFTLSELAKIEAFTDTVLVNDSELLK